MAYNLSRKLVIGLASSALFDLEESDKIFRTEGESAYRAFQSKNQQLPLNKGVAFQFIERLLSVNEVAPDNPPIEVILLSRNDPDTGLRVMNSIKHYNLDITRAIFRQGRSPHRFISALNICLFLSGNETDVRQATIAGYPAGTVLGHKQPNYVEGDELRIAFDFDGVIADDGSERVFQHGGLDAFHQQELEQVNTPHNPGPLKEFLANLSLIQKLEEIKVKNDPKYKKKIRISIVTARNAPSHERVINTMKTWGIQVNEAFFLGGIEKRKVLEVLQPHIFFDDQKLHLEPASNILPAVHIPFGIRNEIEQEKNIEQAS